MLTDGELAQMVERSLSMREVPGSMPGFSIGGFLFFLIPFTYHVFFMRSSQYCVMQTPDLQLSIDHFVHE